MRRLHLLTLTLAMTGCAGATPTPSEAPSHAPSQAVGESLGSSPDATVSPRPAAETGGTFVFIPSVIDCPEGCPIFSVSEALAEPQFPGVPITIRGAVVIEPDGSAWLCERLTGGSPPACDGVRLEFENIELWAPTPSSLEDNGGQELDGVRWLEVRINGEVTPGP